MNYRCQNYRCQNYRCQNYRCQNYRWQRILLVLWLGFAASPARAGTTSHQQDNKQAEEILQKLQDEGRLTPELLSKYPRALIIKSLSSAQQNATGYRSAQIAGVL